MGTFSIVVDQSTSPTSYAIVDETGAKRAHYETMAQAEANLALFADPIPTGTVVEATGHAHHPRRDVLMQDDMHDTDRPPAKKKRAKPKGKSMPRGIPKKKRATKKRSVRAAVNHVAKKTKKRVAKKRRHRVY